MVLILSDYTVYSQCTSLDPFYSQITTESTWQKVSIGTNEKINDEVVEDQNQFLKIVKDITSKGFVRNNYKKKLVDLSDIRINLKGKK